jgi:uncharacterized protein (TIGR02646 family)
MIRVQPLPSSLEALRDWKRKARSERRRMLRAFSRGDSYEFKPAIWRELKKELLRLFRGKCAYCEGRFVPFAWGDVEHFRPKKKVTDELNRTVLVKGKPHQGYYWLAYELRNLLPCCQRCNQARGKMTKFPVFGFRAVRPEQLHREKPMLINPYDDDPDAYLKFVPQTGEVVGLNHRGRVSIDIYNLRREELVDARRDEQDHVRLKLKNAFASGKPASLASVIEQCRLGIRPFSGAAAAEIRDFYGSFGLPSPL